MKRRFVFSLLLIFLFAPQAFATSQVATYDELLHAIRQTRAASQARIETAVEQEKVREAWETGKLIDEHVLHHKERAEYDQEVLMRLAKDLRTSKTELYYMLQFARTYPIFPSTGKLPWGHYRELLSLKDEKQKREVAQEAERKNWTQKELREEIKRRRLATAEDSPAELPEITPGPLNTYQIIKLKDSLKIDLGFGIYRGLSEKDTKKFKEGDIIRVDPSSQNPLSVIARRPEAGVAIPNLYTYSALVTQVVDGDTFHALIDLGFETILAQRVRLRRIDAPEIETAEGKEAKALLEKILSRDKGQIIIQSHDLDQHGRPIADVWVKNKPVDQELLDQGLAVRISE